MQPLAQNTNLVKITSTNGPSTGGQLQLIIPAATYSCESRIAVYYTVNTAAANAVLDRADACPAFQAQANIQLDGL